METYNRKPIKEETPEGQKDEHIKERIQECDGQIAKLKEQLNAANDQKNRLIQQLQRQGKLVKSEQVGEPGPVHKTEEEEIKQLTRQINEANITINKLESDNQRLREGEYAAELEKENLKKEKDEELKELQQTIYQLERELKREQERSSSYKKMLKDAPKKFLQHLQRKGKVCNKDCVLCSLLWICNYKLHVYPCGPHLQRIITIEAEREFGTIENKYLRCDAFMYILLKYEVVKIYYPEYPPEMDDKYDRDFKINEAWEKLMTVDATKRAVTIGRQISKADQVGHCVVCDLETESRKNGSLTIYDPQQEEWGTVNQDDFRSCVKDDEGLILYTVNFEKLKQIIEDHRDILHETSKDCKTNPTGTDKNCMPAIQNMLPVPPNMPTKLKMLPTKPKMLPAEPKMLPAEPKMLPTEPNMLPTEPNMLPTGPNMLPTEPNMLPTGPNMLPTEPNMLPTEPNMLPTEPKMLPTEPNMLPTGPNMLPTGPNMLPTEPNMLPTEPNMLPTEPNTLPTEPNMLPTEPNMLPTEPNMLPTGPNTLPTEPNMLPYATEPVELDMLPEDYEVVGGGQLQ